MDLLIKRTLIIFGALVTFTGCSSQKKLYSEFEQPKVSVRSACRSSALDVVQKETELKQYGQKSSEMSIRKLKIKSSPNISKAHYRIKESQLHLIEKCGQEAVDPTYSLSQVIVLEEIKTKALIELKGDTTLIQSRSLTKSPEVQKNVPDLLPFIQALTESNYKKVSKQLGNK